MSTTASTRELRKRPNVSYKEKDFINLPRAQRSASASSNSGLYPVNAIDKTDSGRVKVHYASKYDEWS